eukprot:CAMPEP_0180629066 /NCGR_PEP_ID=MMETSP1037_2-20121125/39264_1 /TAXON_ID=632150 /ORGANISM="Azadinium spinosum, Strain 3D9" /LENGTH=90 /DNA_ID=CAMNT_0022649845 /DNA_START=216 /DNA_END=488 /DNA_ORIENTATION=-
MKELLHGARTKPEFQPCHHILELSKIYRATSIPVVGSEDLIQVFVCVAQLDEALTHLAEEDDEATIPPGLAEGIPNDAERHRHVDDATHS